MIGSWVPGQMNVTGRMLHNGKGGISKSNEDPFVFGVCAFIFFVLTALFWAFPILDIFYVNHEGGRSVEIILDTILTIFGLLPFVLMCCYIYFMIDSIRKKQNEYMR